MDLPALTRAPRPIPWHRFPGMAYIAVAAVIVSLLGVAFMGIELRTAAQQRAIFAQPHQIAQATVQDATMFSSVRGMPVYQVTWALGNRTEVSTFRTGMLSGLELPSKGESVDVMAFTDGTYRLKMAVDSLSRPVLWVLAGTFWAMAFLGVLGLQPMRKSLQRHRDWEASWVHVTSEAANADGPIVATLGERVWRLPLDRNRLLNWLKSGVRSERGVYLPLLTRGDEAEPWFLDVPGLREGEDV